MITSTFSSNNSILYYFTCLISRCPSVKFYTDNISENISNILHFQVYVWTLLGNNLSASTKSSLHSPSFSTSTNILENTFISNMRMLLTNHNFYSLLKLNMTTVFLMKIIILLYSLKIKHNNMIFPLELIITLYVLYKNHYNIVVLSELNILTSYIYTYLI